MRGLIIINSFHKSRLTRRALEHLVRLTGSAVAYTAFPGHARYLAEEAARRQAGMVMAVGGDGTINEICNGLAGSNTGLAVFPLGTANDLARCMEISARRMLACRDLAACRVRPIDLIKVNEWYFTTVGGFGLSCEVLSQMELMRHTDSLQRSFASLLGRFSYLFALGSILGSVPRSRGEIEIVTETNGLIGEFISLLIANQPRVGQAFRIAPQADNHDGLCDIMLIAPARNKRLSLLSVCSTILPGIHKFENIVRFRGRQFLIKCRQPVRFFGDGEINLNERIFCIEVIPHALRVLVPPPVIPDTEYSLRHPAIRRPKAQVRPALPVNACNSSNYLIRTDSSQAGIRHA